MATSSKCGGAVRIVLVLLALGAAILVAIWPGHGAVIRDAKTLSAALDRARGGEVLRLSPGNFGIVRLANRSFVTPVLITSDDAEHPARIERLALRGVAGLTLRDLVIGSPLAPGEPEYNKMAEVRQCGDITFEKVFFQGSLDGNPANDGWGLYVADCRNVTVRDSRFEELMRGAVFERSQNVTLTNSRFNLMRSDASNFASIQHVTIDRNQFGSFHPIGQDHADAIQFWTLKGPPSTDITISNNVLIDGSGTGPQGIFMNAARTGPYQRVKILNNLLYSGGQWHGIHLEGAEDVIVRGNSTLSRQDDNKVYWIYLKQVTHAEVDENVTERLMLVETNDIKVRRNIDLEKNPGMKHKIKSLRPGEMAVVEGLLLKERGYQPSGGRAN